MAAALASSLKVGRNVCSPPAHVQTPSLTPDWVQWWNCDGVSLTGATLALNSDAEWQHLYGNAANAGAPPLDVASDVKPTHPTEKCHHVG